MSWERKNNTATLFENNDKEMPTHCDYHGEALVDGVEYWINLWVKTSQKGEEYFSVSLNPKKKKLDKPKQTESQSYQQKESDSDLPF